MILKFHPLNYVNLLAIQFQILPTHNLTSSSPKIVHYKVCKFVTKTEVLVFFATIVTLPLFFCEQYQLIKGNKIIVLKESTCKRRIGPEISPKFLSKLEPSPAITQPEKPGPFYHFVSIFLRLRFCCMSLFCSVISFNVVKLFDIECIFDCDNTRRQMMFFVTNFTSAAKCHIKFCFKLRLHCNRVNENFQI